MAVDTKIEKSQSSEASALYENRLLDSSLKPADPAISRTNYLEEIHGPLRLPFRGEVNKHDEAYTIAMPPNSFAVIYADERHPFVGKSKSDETAQFTLPSNNPANYYLDRHPASYPKDPGGHVTEDSYIEILREKKNNSIVSAAMYVSLNGTDAFPEAQFMNARGEKVKVEVRDSQKLESFRSPILGLAFSKLPDQKFSVDAPIADLNSRVKELSPLQIKELEDIVAAAKQVKK
jgi:hypothetical protein